MKSRTAVVDMSGNYEESIQRWGKNLGTSQIRRKLFNVIYGRGTKPRSKKQLMKDAGIKDSDAQQAQNEIEYLHAKHLIARVENDGFVADRSKYLYLKDEHVRPYKDRVIKVADIKRLADNIPTKRNPVVRGATQRVIVTRSALKKRTKLNVLYLTANPDEDNSLRVDAEMRQVKEAVRGSKLRDNIDIHYSPAADLDSVTDGLNDHTPGIVHFSGHGYSGGLAVDHAKVARPKGKVLTFDLLAKALAATDTPPQVVVLNACESKGARRCFLPPARAIIVMKESVSDLAATAFAAKFYAAIAAGQSLKAAFAQGKVAVEVVSINEADTPELIVADGVNPAKIVLT